MDYETYKAAALDIFTREVLGLAKPPKITQSMTLESFASDARFKKEFVDMFADRCFTKMGFNIRNQKNKPLVEIIDYLADQLEKRAKFGHLPQKNFKKRY